MSSSDEQLTSLRDARTDLTIARVVGVLEESVIGKRGKNWLLDTTDDGSMRKRKLRSSRRRYHHGQRRSEATSHANPNEDDPETGLPMVRSQKRGSGNVLRSAVNKKGLGLGSECFYLVFTTSLTLYHRYSHSLLSLLTFI